MHKDLVLFLGITASLFMLSAFISLAETALLSVNRLRIRSLAKRGDPKAILIKQYISAPSKVIGTLLIADNFVDVGVGSITAYYVGSVVGRGRGIYDIAAVFLITVALVIFGKILPKTIAAYNPEPVAMRIVNPLRLLMLVLNPLVKIATFVSNYWAKRLGVKVELGPVLRAYTEDELLTMMTDSPQVLNKDKRELIRNVFKIGDRRIKEIMIPRTEVISIDIDAPPKEILSVVINSGYSRFPVYRRHFDNVLGILYTKNFLFLLGRDRPTDHLRPVDLEKMLHTAFFIPDAAKIETALKQLQRLHVHMAMVVDEFGGVEGIVTLEDIVEEIVGEIQDEYDFEHELIRRVSPDTFIIDGTMAVKDFNREFSLHLPETNHYSTVAGFLISLTGRLLKEGDRIKFENITFDVEKMKGHRASLIRVKVVPALVPELARK